MPDPPAPVRGADVVTVTRAENSLGDPLPCVPRCARAPTRIVSGMDSIFNLPAHPLLVHVPVICVPLAAFGAVLIALRPGWRRAYGPIVVALAAIGAIGALLAAGSGESLQESRNIRDLGDHAEYGDMAQNVSFVLLGLVVVLVALDRWRTHPRLRRVPSGAVTAVAVLTIAASMGAAAVIVLAGHSGAKRVWLDDETGQEQPR